MSSEVADEHNLAAETAFRCPVCVECKTKESAFWHRSSSGDAICNACHVVRQDTKDSIVTRTLRSQVLPTVAAGVSGSNSTSKSINGSPCPTDSVISGLSRTVGSNLINSTRKSNRLKPLTKTRTVQNVSKPSLSKGRSRKVILKKNPLKAPIAVSTIVPSEYIFYKGNYWQVGDVVSVVDEDDNQTYYAQLRGFLQDQFCSKSAVLTWLIPTTGDDDCDQLPSDFDPKLYVAGPEEDLPRDMSHFEFVCHAPSDYFNHRSAYCSRVVNPPALGCIWTRFGPEIQAVGSSPNYSSDRSFTENDSRLARVDGNEREVGKRSSFRGQSLKMTSSRLKDKVAK